jgi:hypothetical protein
MLKQNENELNLIKSIETCDNENEITQILNSNKSHNLKDKLNQTINQNETLLKNVLLEHTDSIIKLFTNTKNISEEIQKSKKSIDTNSSQMIM